MFFLEHKEHKALPNEHQVTIYFPAFIVSIVLQQKAEGFLITGFLN
jgi:hypothetical protein